MRLQKISDEALVDCPECGQSTLRKLLSAPRFRLAGKGWYETDFKTSNKRNIAGEAEKSDKPKGGESKDKSKDGDSKNSDGKVAAKRPRRQAPSQRKTARPVRLELSLVKAFRRYLVAGILVWAPLAVTYLLLKFAVNVMDRTLQWIPAQYQPGVLLQQLFQTAEPVQIPGLGVILTIAVLLLTGVLAANFVGRAFVGGWESLMHRIPVVRSIYSAAKNFAEMVFSDSSQSFKNVLLIEYPRKGLYSLAFQTSHQAR